MKKAAKAPVTQSPRPAVATNPKTPRPNVARQTRVDQPLESRRRSINFSVDPETVGKLSERIARFLGSWVFIGYMTAFVAIWILWNTIGPESLRFDPWQFIGLTLLLSLQASYAAPLILLAANRQADRDRIQYLEDRNRDERIVADVEYLAREVAALRIALGEVATREFLRSELRELSDDLAEALGEIDGVEPKPERKGKSKSGKNDRSRPSASAPKKAE